jgi:hypothetical protein
MSTPKESSSSDISPREDWHTETIHNATQVVRVAIVNFRAFPLCLARKCFILLMKTKVHLTLITRPRQRKLSWAGYIQSTYVNSISLTSVLILFSLLRLLPLCNTFIITFQDQNFLASLILATHATYPTQPTFLDFVVHDNNQNLYSYSEHSSLRCLFPFILETQIDNLFPNTQGFNLCPMLQDQYIWRSRHNNHKWTLF